MLYKIQFPENVFCFVRKLIIRDHAHKVINFC